MVMEKRKEKKVRKTITEVIEVKYFCDKCGTEIDIDTYEIESYKVQKKVGSHYPGSGYDVECHGAYFCKDCWTFVEKLLLNNGIKVYKLW